MAFKFSIGQQNVLNQERKFLLDEVSELCEAKCALDEHFGKFDAVENVMENISTSLKALDTIEDSDDVLKVLNMDQSMENLLGVAEDAITKKIATEGLGEALKKVWETFKRWCNEAWTRIKTFFKKIWYWLTGRDKADKAAAEYSKALLDSSLKQLDEITKRSNELAKKAGEARTERARAAIRGRIDEIIKSKKKAADDVQTAVKDFKKTASDPKSTARQIDDSSKKVHETVKEYHEVSKDAYSKAKEAVAEAPSVPAAPPTPPIEKPKPAPPPPPPPSEPKEYNGPKAEQVKLALTCFKQLSNSLMTSWNTQAKNVKDLFKQFVGGNMTLDAAKESESKVIACVNTVVGVINNSIDKLGHHINEETESSHISWKASDDSKKAIYVKFENVQQLGFASCQEAFSLCTKLRQLLSSISGEIGKAADDFYIDYLELDEFIDSGDEVKVAIGKAGMSLYRTAMMMERLAAMVCQFTGGWCASGTSDIIQCCKDHARLLESRASACAKAVASQL